MLRKQSQKSPGRNRGLIHLSFYLLKAIMIYLVRGWPFSKKTRSLFSGKGLDTVWNIPWGKVILPIKESKINIFEDVSPLTNKRRDQKYLTEDEIEKLKAACDTFSDQLIVYGLLYTGMRVNELCHMKPHWIDFKGGSITIPKQEGDWHPKIVHVWDSTNNRPKKSYISNRTLAILNTTLLEILKSMVQHKYALNMTPKEVWFRLNQLWRKTGERGRISPHMLRHTCLTYMCRKNISIPTVAMQAGHHSLEVTVRDYIHSDPYYALKEIKEKGGI